MEIKLRYKYITKYLDKVNEKIIDTSTGYNEMINIKEEVNNLLRKDFTKRYKGKYLLNDDIYWNYNEDYVVLSYTDKYETYYEYEMKINEPKKARNLC